jgi:small subunit ribosomal protein S16
MTKIRLARTGSTHQPHYRIVVTDSRNRRDGRFIEILGAYHPIQGGEVTLNQDRAAYWLSVGAQPSNTVIGLLNKAKVKHGFSVRRKPERQPEAKAVEPEAEIEATEEVATPEATEAGDQAIAEQPLSDQAAEAASETPVEESASPDSDQA